MHGYGNVESDFLAGVFEIAVKALFESQFVRGDFKTRFGVLVDIHFFRHGSLRHAKFSFGTDSLASFTSNGVRPLPLCASSAQKNLSSLDSRAESMLRLRQLFFSGPGR